MPEVYHRQWQKFTGISGTQRMNQGLKTNLIIDTKEDILRSFHNVSQANFHM